MHMVVYKVIDVTCFNCLAPSRLLCRVVEYHARRQCLFVVAGWHSVFRRFCCNVIRSNTRWWPLSQCALAFVRRQFQNAVRVLTPTREYWRRLHATAHVVPSRCHGLVFNSIALMHMVNTERLYNFLVASPRCDTDWFAFYKHSQYHTKWSSHNSEERR